MDLGSKTEIWGFREVVNVELPRIYCHNAVLKSSVA